MTNVASDTSFVGVQASVVHGGVHTHVVSPDAPPEQKFEAGRQFLDSEAPGMARQLIGDAVGARYVTDEVCFYWLLALVSGRARDELSDDEAGMLRNWRTLMRLDGGVWADGAEVIDRLLHSAQTAQTSEADVQVLLKELDDIGEPQSGLIQKHLAMFLEGPLRDAMWSRELDRARTEQLAGDRAARVWKFFEPDPLGPRERPLHEPTVLAGTRALAVAAGAAFTVAAAYVGFVLAEGSRAVALLAYLLSIGGGAVGARTALEWRFRELRRRAKDEEYGPPGRRRTNARPDGFAKNVEGRFGHYFARYLPRGVERQNWLAQTAGIRRSMRDELATLYREERTGVERITWLIRYRAGDVRSRWQDGTLWNYRTELATPLRTKMLAVLGLAVLVGGGLFAVAGTSLARPQGAAVSTAFLLAGGWAAVHTWLPVVLERRGYAADKAERAQVLAKDRQAYRAWLARLAEKPEDREMAAWLDCDRKMLLAEALRHYRLSMSDVLTHGFVEEPAPSAGRARLRRGPWRYLKYRLRVFLLTEDGVRQLEADLDFEQGELHERQRTNFRYDAVTAVRVRQRREDERRAFELTLVDGQKIEVQMIGPGMEELQPGENPGDVAEVTLDAAGLGHTLHVLEGIAAEGKPWIKRQNRRGPAPV